MPGYAFTDPVTSEAELREVLGMPGDIAVQKQIAALDKHARLFVERSPFALLSSSDAAGNCDVSPRGDGPGFVHILDDQTLLVPERPGNRRADTLTNVLENPHVGLLFLIPNVDETLRVNGSAQIVRDPELLAPMAFRGKTPLLALAVELDEVFFHCPKAFRRSGLWKPATWPDRSEIPTLGQILLDQVKLQNTTAEQLDCELEDSYQKRLY